MPALLTGMRFVEKKERLGYPELATGVAIMGRRSSAPSNTAVG